MSWPPFVPEIAAKPAPVFACAWTARYALPKSRTIVIASMTNSNIESLRITPPVFSGLSAARRIVLPAAEVRQAGQISELLQTRFNSILRRCNAVRNVLRRCAGYEVLRHDAARPDAPACDGVAKDEIDAGEIFGLPFVEEMFLHGVTAPDEGSE